LALRFFFADAVAFLNFPSQNFLIALHLCQVVIGELAPTAAGPRLRIASNCRRSDPSSSTISFVRALPDPPQRGREGSARKGSPIARGDDAKPRLVRVVVALCKATER
jgi:hypothetical protein